jgi:DNA-directed RNA polymerase subunit RPC12/RpoP
MKCGSCSVEIKPEFTYARKSNICPSCGNQIMPPERVELFNKLKELVGPAFATLDLSGPVCLDFGELDIYPMPAKVKVKQSAVEVDEDDDGETRSISSNRVSSGGQKSLQDLRKEAYDDAIRDQWGLNEPDAGQLLIESKQEQARENMLTGAGKVRRG